MAARHCGSDTQPWPPASPTLASPSVSMMTMEVLLSGTMFSSRAFFNMLMPLSSPSLMLVTGTWTTPWEGVRGVDAQGAGMEELGTLGPYKNALENSQMVFQPPHWDNRGAVKTSFVIFHKKQPMLRVLCSLISLGFVGHHNHGLKTERRDFLRHQRRHPEIKPEDPHLIPTSTRS